MKKQDDFLIDTFDVSEDYYNICAEKKLKGASNSELKAFLNEQGLSESERNAIVKQVDSDYLSGLIKPKRNIPRTKLLLFILGWVLLLGALIILILMLVSGIVSGFVIFICAGLASAGGGMIAQGSKRGRA